MKDMKLFDYQKAGVAHLVQHNHALLADEMGLGKTIQAIVAAKEVGCKKLCVICPAIARGMWHRELKTWGYEGKVIVESYSRIARNKAAQQKISDMKPDVLILDEAHYLKNRGAKRTTVIYGHHACGSGLVAAANRVWLLTGTPAPNNASELWTHFKALWPQLIPSRVHIAQNYWEFITTWCFIRRGTYGVEIYGNRNPTGLRNLLANVMLRRRAEAVLTDLPPIHITTHLIDPLDSDSDYQKYLKSPEYEDISDIIEKAIDEDAPWPDIEHLATLRRLTGIAKAGAVAELVAEELEAGAYNKIVLFAIHRAALDDLESGLEEYECVRIDGSTTPVARQVAIDTFQKDENCRVFIGQLNACGTAITLTAAHHAALVECSWTPADNWQASKRCHRIGQTRPVFVRIFALANSIDDAVSSILAHKTRMLNQLNV